MSYRKYPRVIVNIGSNVFLHAAAKACMQVCLWIKDSKPRQVTTNERQKSKWDIRGYDV